jgi:protein ImuA
LTHLGVFAAVILARLKGPVLWCLASRDLFAPALTRAGLHLDQVIHADTWRDTEVLPVMEGGVSCPGLAGVVGEIPRPGLGRPRWRVELLHCRGAPGGSDLCCWVLEALR